MRRRLGCQFSPKLGPVTPRQKNSRVMRHDLDHGYTTQWKAQFHLKHQFPDGTGGGVGVAWVDCKYPADANNCVPVVQRQRLCFGGLSYSPGMVWEGYVRLCMHLCVCALEIWRGFDGDQEPEIIRETASPTCTHIWPAY